jgi:AcrR family transcriptional regulator
MPSAAPYTNPTSRIERRKTEFRDKITDAALKLFAENGVADTSVASIIKEADIAHKTFFNHFPTKDHLLQHIVSSHARYAYSFFRDALKQHTDPQKQIAYCLMSIANALQPLNPERYRELVTFYIVSSASTKEFREEQKQNFRELVQNILQDAESKKMVRQDFDLETLGEMIVGICVSTLLNWCVETDFPIVDKMKKSVKFINQSVFIN